jgi:hypothetical protein
MCNLTMFVAEANGQTAETNRVLFAYYWFFKFILPSQTRPLIFIDVLTFF